jgi:hypothetical protein
MVAIPRTPKGQGRITRSTLRKYRYNAGDYILNSKLEPGAPIGSLVSVSQNYAFSNKSTYAKGAVVTLLGGMKFRKSTTHWIEYAEIPEQAGAYNAHCWFKAKTHHQNWNVSDSGRESGFLVDSIGPIIGITIPTDARNEAVVKALNKIADQKVNLGENLATLGQTVRMFANYASILTGALNIARGKKSWRPFLGKSRRTIEREGPLTRAASEYLAYVYGLKPLMQDLFNTTNTMKALSGQTLLFKGVGKATRLKATSTKSPVSLSYSRITSQRGQSMAKVKCTIWGQLDPNTQSLRAMNQLGLLNPLGLAWDLVPWSFVVDWFLPIGPVLYALSAPAGLLFVDGSLSIRCSETETFRYDVSTTGFQYEGRQQDAPCNESPLILDRTYEGFSRETFSNWPLPGFYFDQDPFRGDRPYKAVALAVMLLGKHKNTLITR